jgi:hypothetical protein
LPEHEALAETQGLHHSNPLIGKASQSWVDAPLVDAILLNKQCLLNILTRNINSIAQLA